MTERREEYGEFGEYTVDWDDQLQPDDTLDYRGVDDVLDEGIVTREGWSAAQGYGNTAAEQHEGGGLSHYLEQEESEPVDVGEGAGEGAGEDYGEEYVDDDQVGDVRSGRLVADLDGEDIFVHDVGIDGAAASAEEAAVHVIPEEA